MEFAQCKFLSCAEVARFGLTQNARLQALAQITFQLRNPGETTSDHSLAQISMKTVYTHRRTTAIIPIQLYEAQNNVPA